MGDALDLMGTADIAALLDVSTQRVDQLSRTDGFPPPAATVSAGRVRIWHRADIETWARETGRA